MSHSTHLLIYPYSESGHIIPLLDLTDLLLRRGLTVTVIISPAKLPLLDPLHSSHPSSFHKLLLSDPQISSSSSRPIMRDILSTQKQFDPIVKWFRSHPFPPIAIVSDFFLGWTSELASHLGIQRVVFITSGVLASSIMHTLWRDPAEINDENSDEDANSLISFPEIPNSPEFPSWQYHRVRYHKKERSYVEAFRKGLLTNMTSWGVVYNTFEELEGVYIDHIKKQMGHDRVWAVGPLLPLKNDPVVSSGRGGLSVVPPDDLLMWLDNKPDDSVVYICFGSRATLNEKQMCALMGALELSNVNFVLCTKANDSSFISSGFKDRVSGRGFIVKGWVPQLVILRHQAVGSFITHCGWNSILEGVASGVMMLTWPMGFDQFGNAKLLVDELGVGKRVCESGPDNVPDSIELARLLDGLLSENVPERVKVKELSQSANMAVKEGTSTRDLNNFIKLLSEL